MNKKAICIVMISVLICCFAACGRAGAKSVASNAAADGLSVSQEAGGEIEGKAQIGGTQESSSQKNAESTQSSADNAVNFEPQETTTQAKTTKSNTKVSTTASPSEAASQGTGSENEEQTTQAKEPATDENGWINKWY